MLGWDSPLRAVAGSRATKLVKGLEIETVGDLLQHYPRTFIARGQTSDAGDFVEGEYQTVVAEVHTSAVHPYKDKRTGRLAFRVVVTAMVGQTPVQMTFFDRQQRTADWRVGVLRPGATIMFAGKAGWNHRSHGWELVHPSYDEVEPEHAEEALAQLRRAYPTDFPRITDFDLKQPTDYPEGSDEGYVAIRRDFIDPIEAAWKLTLRISTAIANEFGAHG